MSKESALTKYGMKPLPVLGQGYVMLVDLMGDDQAIVDAARVSYGKGTRKTSENRGLIRYLIRHKHTSPIEMAEIKLQIKLPLFTAGQMIRHRTASINSLSYRYSEAEDEFYVPELEHITGQDAKNKQSRGTDLPKEVRANTQRLIEDHQASIYSLYKVMLETGVARELARIELPQSTFTSWVWKIDLKNLLHFIRLRAENHAQYEIQVYANAIAEIVKEWVPLVWEAFEDYEQCSYTLSKQELQALKEIIKRGGTIPSTLLSDAGLNKREAEELVAKLNIPLC